MKNKILFFLLIFSIFVETEAQQITEKDGDLQNLSKITTSKDDAFGVLDKGELINVIGNQGIISDTYYQNLIYNFRWPKSKGLANIQGTNATDDVSILFASKGNVIDAYTRYRNEDFQAIPGSRGHYFADEQPSYLLAPDGAPRLATSDIPLTWPEGYFDSTKTWHNAPTGTYAALSEKSKSIVDSKGAFYDKDAKVWRFWPGKFRIDVDPKSATFGQQIPGEFAGDREVYSIFDDHNAQPPSIPMGIVVQMQAICYGRRFAQDIQFYDFLITNTSEKTLDSCYFGFYVDFQFGDSGDETWGSYKSKNDIPGYDNVFYQFDYNGPNPGNLEDGVIGMIVLRTPDSLGITDGHFFRDLSGSVTPSDDRQIWPVLISNPDDPNIVPSNYFHGSNVHFDDFSLTEDGKTPGVNNWSMFISTGPFVMQPGETKRETAAFAAQKNLSEFKRVITEAQKLSLTEFNGPSAPPSPKLFAVPGDQKVTLYWNDNAENVSDPVSKKKDFEGYKLYRSEDQGSTWGQKIISASGGLVGYIPIAQFDKKDFIQGIDPINNYNFLGSNTGIRHYYVDSTVNNGVFYSYTITAYDSGSVSNKLESLESSKGATAADANLVDVVPRSNPIGFKKGSWNIVHVSGIANAVIEPSIIDPVEMTNDSYLLSFNKTPADSVIVSSATAKKILTKTPIDKDEMVVVNGVRFKVTGDSKTGEVKTITDELGNDVYNSNHLNEVNNWYVALGTINHLADTITQSSSYEFRFTSGGSFASGLTGQNKPLIKKYHVPYEVWNISHPDSQYQINTILLDDNHNDSLDLSEEIRIVNVPYKVSADTLGKFNLLKWFYSITIDTVGNEEGTLPQDGQSFKITSYSQLAKQDTFNVTFNKPIVSVDRNVIKNSLNEVRVVPNPFVVHAIWEQLENNRKLRFMYLPAECTISIYTVAGELVKRIEHINGTGDEDWNLTNESGVEVSFGVYLYVVKINSGDKKIGKFAIIK